MIAEHQEIQSDLLEETPLQKFERWKQTPGARHVLRKAYAIAAYYAARYRKTHRRVSMKLIWELLRDHVSHVRTHAKPEVLAQFEGYTLNNIFTPYIARHILAHKPEWAGMFELRELHTK
jgi:hypothetical protein